MHGGSRPRRSPADEHGGVQPGQQGQHVRQFLQASRPLRRRDGDRAVPPRDDVPDHRVSPRQAGLLHEAAQRLGGRAGVVPADEARVAAWRVGRRRGLRAGLLEQEQHPRLGAAVQGVEVRHDVGTAPQARHVGREGSHVRQGEQGPALSPQRRVAQRRGRGGGLLQDRWPQRASKRKMAWGAHGDPGRLRNGALLGGGLRHRLVHGARRLATRGPARRRRHGLRGAARRADAGLPDDPRGRSAR